MMIKYNFISLISKANFLHASGKGNKNKSLGNLIVVDLF